jgi:hypothetical protein
LPDDRLAGEPPRLTRQVPSALLDSQVQNGLNLYLPLKSPAQMPALLEMLKGMTPTVNDALESLHYVHFARFLPAPDGSALWVITSYDGTLRPYLMDFIAVLGDVFTGIMRYVRGSPPLPVRDYPVEFCEFVERHDIEQAKVWSAYPELTVIDILRSTRQP